MSKVENMSDIKSEIVGCWRLCSYIIKGVNEEKNYLWGKNADGVIIYLENGYMSVHVSNKDRQKFGDNDFLHGKDEEVRKAFEGYTTYFGTYEYKPDEGLVLHHINEALYPNWSGITHTRFVQCEGDKLSIKTPPISIAQKECVMELSWVKV